MKESKIKTLVLYSYINETLAYLFDWQDAFEQHPALDSTLLDINQIAESQKTIKANIQDYELIVLLHSTNGFSLGTLKKYKKLLNQRTGKLVIFIGEELNYAQKGIRMQDKINFMKEINPDFIATMLLVDTARKIYEDVTSATVLGIPHALNPKRFYPTTPNNERSIDIGTTSHRYWPFLGDQERNNIMEFFSSLNRDDLKIQIKASQGVQGRYSVDSWPKFLNSCKGTVATEAGGYYLEKDDRTVTNITKHFQKQQGIVKRNIMPLIEKYKNKIPVPISVKIQKLVKKMTGKRVSYNDTYYDLDFNEIYELFFKNYQNPLNGKTISSRHFDAIGTKTCQIMFDGRFNDILVSGKHYIALKRDFSNIKQVLEQFKDDEYRNNLVDETYEFVRDNHTHVHRIEELLSHI
ncbi:hypothetical protein BKI52_25870 [marine bacterium AO1-C]|nr:hypothetical protein BKI52_25870 [marine bacterium AO1-C]